MKKNALLVIAFAVLFLFIIQSMGTLFESIYILDLMNTRLDEKALGVLFFFAPLLLLPFFRLNPRILAWVLSGLLLICRGLIPYLTTSNRMITSGFASAVSFGLLFLLITAWLKTGRWAAAGLALAVALSTLLRTVGYGLEYSLTPAGSWVGWLLGLLLVLCLILADMHRQVDKVHRVRNRTLPVVGIYLVLTLVYFSFSAPSVIARWTEGNYTLIVLAVSFLSLAYAWVSITHPEWLARLSTNILVGWNLLFTASLTFTLLAHRVPFPPSPDAAAVEVGSPSLLQMLPLGLMLLLFPVIYFDFHVFIQRMHAPGKSRGSLVPGILLGSLALIVLVFINIFTNVWGYIEPISPPFRNTFWLAYFLLSSSLTLLVWLAQRGKPAIEAEPSSIHWAWVFVPLVVFLVTLIFALPRPRLQADPASATSLRVMTFNTQQSNDETGEKSFEAQLALIRQVSPDILSLQETDSARISLNNNDYVRYFAEKLGYYSYYGPKPVTGTYGTAILSRFPLENTRTAFIYSDKDETGVAEAEVAVGGQRFTIYDVHPDGSDLAMVIFAKTLLSRSLDKTHVIALGDYNLRDYEDAYQIIDRVYTNAWTSVYPSEISPDGVDMSGENRIDHIFFSPNLTAVDPKYILPPESATDHPVHWTDIVWNNP